MTIVTNGRANSNRPMPKLQPFVFEHIIDPAPETKSAHTEINAASKELQSAIEDKRLYVRVDDVITLALLRGLEAGFALGMRLAATPAQMVLREE